MKSLIFIALLYYFNVIYADDFIGCGGFIKSKVDINYSQIEVRTNHTFLTTPAKF